MTVLTLVLLLFMFKTRFKIEHRPMRFLFRIIAIVIRAAGSTVKIPSYDHSRNHFLPPEECRAEKREVHRPTPTHTHTHTHTHCRCVRNVLICSPKAISASNVVFAKKTSTKNKGVKRSPREQLGYGISLSN